MRKARVVLRADTQPFKRGEAVSLSVTQDGLLLERGVVRKRSAVVHCDHITEYEYLRPGRVEDGRGGGSAFWQSFFGALALGHFGAALGYMSSKRQKKTHVVEDAVFVTVVNDAGHRRCVGFTAPDMQCVVDLERELLPMLPPSAVADRTATAAWAKLEKERQQAKAKPPRHVEY